MTPHHAEGASRVAGAQAGAVEEENPTGVGLDEPVGGGSAEDPGTDHDDVVGLDGASVPGRCQSGNGVARVAIDDKIWSRPGHRLEMASKEE
jgi:hypothetical protein